MFTPDDLFVHNINRLKKAVSEPSAENLLDSARCLRQLLFDENSLLHQVNRERRLKVIFEINPLTKFPPDLGIDQNWLVDGMSPRISPPKNNPALKLKLDGFFKHPIAELFGDIITVKDAVQYVANYGGAIHKSTPDTPMTQALERISQAMEIGGVPSVLRTLLGISDVTIEACAPLFEAIQKEKPG